MNKKSIIGVAVLLLVVGGLGTWHFLGHPTGGHDHGAAHDHGHDHGGGPSTLALNDGKKWATDEALRAGMSRMHEAVIPAYGAFQAGNLTPDAAKALAQTIRKEIDFLVANCKLDPQADAMLHIVIANLLTGAGAAEGDPASQAGVPAIVAALHDYEKHFDHPGF